MLTAVPHRLAGTNRSWLSYGVNTLCHRISSVCARLRQETAEVADRRISLMNELVTGIRVLKTHAWEENYREKVEEIRR